MNPIYNRDEHFKARGEMPQDLSWDDLQEGIYAKMDRLQGLRKRRNKPNRWLWLLLLLLTGIGGCYFLSKIENQDITTDFAEKVIDLQPNNKFSQLDQKEKNQDIDHSNKPDDRMSVEDKSIVTTNISGGSLITHLDTNISPDEAHSSIELKVNSNDHSKLENIDVNNEIIPENEKIVETQLHIKESKILFKEEVLTLSTLQIQSISSLKPSFSPPPILMSLVDSEEDTDINRKKWSVSIGGGINDWSLNRLASSLTTEREAFETQIIGHEVCALLELDLTNRFSIGVGLGYSQLFNLFRYYNVNEFQEILENQVVAIRTSSLTGLMSETRSLLSRTITETRQVQNYNRTDLISIPISLRHRWKIDRFSLNAGVGIEMGFMLHSSGKTIENEEVIEFDSTQPIYSKGLTLSPSVILGGSYDISNAWFVTLEVSYSGGLQNWSAEIEQSARPRIGRSVIRLGRRF